MAKTAEQRFNAALGTLLTLSARDMAYFKGYSGVLEWLSQQVNKDAAKRTVGAKLALGGRGLTRFDSVTKYREVMRAYLLGADHALCPGGHRDQGGEGRERF